MSSHPSRKNKTAAAKSGATSALAVGLTALLGDQVVASSSSGMEGAQGYDAAALEPSARAGLDVSAATESQADFVTHSRDVSATVSHPATLAQAEVPPAAAPGTSPVATPTPTGAEAGAATGGAASGTGAVAGGVEAAAGVVGEAAAAAGSVAASAGAAVASTGIAAASALAGVSLGTMAVVGGIGLAVAAAASDSSDSNDEPAPGETGPTLVPESLVELAAMQTNPVTGKAGDDFVIQGGVGNIGTRAIDTLGLDFNDALDVTLQMTAADAALDGAADGTIQLNTSLSGLAGMGIDHVTGSTGQDVTVDGGFGAAGGEFASPVFAAGLDVTVDMVEADGTVALNTSLTGLSALGIDHVVSTDNPAMHVDIAGGVGAGLNAATTLVQFADSLNVTLHLPADSGEFPIASAQRIADSGVDYLGAGEISLDLSDVSALIAAGLDFTATSMVTLDLDADVAATALLGEDAPSLADLGKLGIDSVVVTEEEDTIALKAGGDVIDGMDANELEDAIAGVLAQFADAEPPVFDDADEVTLHIGNNDVATLSAEVLDGIQLLGIDYLQGADGTDHSIDDLKA